MNLTVTCKMRRDVMPEKNELQFCQERIEQMLRRSQTKVIFPLITLGLLQACKRSGKTIFSDSEVRTAYQHAVGVIKRYLKHDLHVGGKYYDAYPSRNMTRYGVLKALGDKQYLLTEAFSGHAKSLISWIPEKIQEYISLKLGVIPQLADRATRIRLSEGKGDFLTLITEHIDKNPVNFEIVSFAIIKIHLEKFACKVYRDTRSSAHDKGVDISTNFGVVYQIKKLRLDSRSVAESVYAELKANFDKERLDDGKVILVIDDISSSVKNYLIDMKVHSISKKDLLTLASQIEDVEDREKIFRVIHEEFRREYASDI